MSFDQGGFKILLVDDDPGICRELKLFLEEEGHSVATADNGKNALEILSKDDFDLLVTDIYMPIMDGLDLVLIAKRNYPHLKILAISGGKRMEDDGQVSLEYFNVISKFTNVPTLRKPFRSQKFLGAVNDLLVTK